MKAISKEWKALFTGPYNAGDLIYFIRALQNIYRNKGGMENIFNEYKTKDSLQSAIHEFYKVFL